MAGLSHKGVPYNFKDRGCDAGTLFTWIRRRDAEQMLLVQDGVVVAQWLVATRLAYHAGSGNPEMIGQSLSVFQGRDFAELRNGTASGVPRSSKTS
jgi:hypothetical protein